MKPAPIFTDSDSIDDTLRSLRVHGKGVDKYDNIRIGMNSRLDTLQAAILLEKLSIFDKEIEQRNLIASHYREELKSENLLFQYIPKNYTSVYAQFSILFDNMSTRNKVQRELSDKGIPSVIYYGIPGHLQSGYKQLGYSEGDLPVSEDLSKRILSLPMHPYMNEQDVSKIVLAIKESIN